MNSKRSFKLVRNLVVAVAALVLSAGMASAQSAFEGKFRLPTSTRWGQTLLPAGEYTFSLDSAALPAIIKVRAQGKVAMIMAQGATTTSLHRSELVIAPNGGIGSVRAMTLAELGLTFTYSPRKGEPPLMARATEPSQHVRIVTSGK